MNFAKFFTVIIIAISVQANALDAATNYDYPKVITLWKKAIEFKNTGLQSDKNGVTDAELETKYLKALDTAAKAYFQSAKIKIEGLGEKKEVIKVGENFRAVSVTSESFYLTGDPNGDGNSRLIHAITELGKKGGFEAKVLYQPVLSLKGGNMAAYFDPLTKTITVDAFSLYRRALGASDAFLHEAQHLFEFDKTRRGLPSLTRFSLRESESKEPIYGTYFSLDELEAYLIELRYFKGPAKRARAAMGKLDPEGKIIFDDTAAQSEIFVRKVLAALIPRAEAFLNALENIQDPLSMGPPSHFPGEENVMKFMLMSGLTSDTSAFLKYDAVARPLKLQHGDFKGRMDALKIEIDLARERVQQIKAEVNQ